MNVYRVKSIEGHKVVCAKDMIGAIAKFMLHMKGQKDKFIAENPDELDSEILDAYRKEEIEGPFSVELLAEAEEALL
jgi:hypothetical protein